MITIKDVANHAGVSIATVSRVMNNADNVGEEYRTAVLKAIEELDYRPNAVAQSLKSRRFKTIGVIVSDFSVSFFEWIIKDIEQKFCIKGHMLLFVNTYDSPELEKRGIQFMLEKQADIILICSTGENEDYLKKIQHEGISVIFFDRRPREYAFPMVIVDKREAMYRTLDYLWGIGHRRIALISGPLQMTSNYDRYMGITDYLYDHNISPRAISYFFGEFSEKYGYSTMKALMKSKSGPTAIVTGSSVIAIGVYVYCAENQLRIPEDVSVVSFGDFSCGQIIYPRLSYIDDEHNELSKHLIRMIQKAFNEELTEKEIIIHSQIQINHSAVEISGVVES